MSSLGPTIKNREGIARYIGASLSLVDRLIERHNLPAVSETHEGGGRRWAVPAILLDEWLLSDNSDAFMHMEGMRLARSAALARIRLRLRNGAP